MTTKYMTKTSLLQPQCYVHPKMRKFNLNFNLCRKNPLGEKVFHFKVHFIVQRKQAYNIKKNMNTCWWSW